MAGPPVHADPSTRPPAPVPGAAAIGVDDDVFSCETDRRADAQCVPPAQRRWKLKLTQHSLCWGRHANPESTLQFSRSFLARKHYRFPTRGHLTPPAWTALTSGSCTPGTLGCHLENPGPAAVGGAAHSPAAGVAEPGHCASPWGQGSPSFEGAILPDQQCLGLVGTCPPQGHVL